MSNLTDEDRAALLTPCECGHTINDHGSLVACWRCEDEGGDCETPFEALLAERLEGIVAREVERAEAQALRVVRLVERDMSEQALQAWRSADARRGLSDHAALEVHADALTRWSERFRMALNGEDYRADRIGGES